MAFNFPPNLKEKINLYFVKVKRFIYSAKCSSCGKIVEDERRYICNKCYKILKKKGTLKNFENNYFLYYYEEDIKNIIADFKLQNRRYLSKEIGSLIKSELEKLIKEKKIDYVIPVPISAKRLRERGFNQVEELLDIMKIKYKKIYRIKDTKHMYELLNEEDRQKNIKNAFKINFKIDNKNILLFDDIVTTGHTIDELVKEIKKKSNPKNIYIFSIAISKIFDKNLRYKNL